MRTNPAWRIIVMNDDRAVRHRPAIHRPASPRPGLRLSPPEANARKRNEFCGRMSWRYWPASASRPPAHTVGADQCSHPTPAPHSQSGVPRDYELSRRQCILTYLERVEATLFSYRTVGHRGRHVLLEKDGAPRLANAEASSPINCRTTVCIRPRGDTSVAVRKRRRICAGAAWKQKGRAQSPPFVRSVSVSDLISARAARRHAKAEPLGNKKGGGNLPSLRSDKA